MQVASSIRVMVVEDFQPFREMVCSRLQQRPELRVVCEVSDGLEAVQKAEELKPDSYITLAHSYFRVLHGSTTHLYG